MGNPLEDSFVFVLDRVEVWWASLRDMPGVARRILDENPTPRLRVRAAASLWFSSAFLAMIVTLPAYSFYGLKLENASFQISMLMFQYFAFLFFSWFLHRGLKLYRIQSNYVDTLVLYTIVGAALAPLNALASLPGSMHILSVIRESRAAQTGPFVALGRVWISFNRPSSDILMIAVSIIAPPLIALSVVAIGVTIRLFATHYAVAEWDVARAFSCAMLVLMPVPFLLLVLSSVSIYYVFVG